MNRIEGKVALVTGAGQGIGRGIAEVLSKAGAKIVVTDIVEESGKATVSGIKAAGGEAIFCSLNVTKEEEWGSVTKAAVAAYGGLDVVVNNAGVNIFNMVENLTGEQWRQGMAINAEGVFYGVKHGILAMKPGGIAGKGGSIVNISSVTAFIAVAGTSCYSASKAAVNMLTKVAAVECGQFKYGIRVNSIHPGVIRTPFTVAGFETMGKEGGFGSAAAAEAAHVALHPIGRLGEPEDVGEAVLYLASDASSFVTGSSLVVDGGWTAQ
jgi:3alpha(or 20beta)-hydroxysteroid dehydrogenase